MDTTRHVIENSDEDVDIFEEATIPECGPIRIELESIAEETEETEQFTSVTLDSDVVYDGEMRSADGVKVEHGYEDEDDYDSDMSLGDCAVDPCDTLVAEICKHEKSGTLTKREYALSCANFALPLHYFVAGSMHAIVSGLLYGTLMGVMAVEAHVYATACIIVDMPWCTKFVFGFLSDWFPIWGYRRRYYAIIGWSIVGVSYALLAATVGNPGAYYCQEERGSYDENVVCNKNAARGVASFVALIVIGTLGLAIAESAADALMVEASQATEPISSRGRLQLNIYIIRLMGTVTGCVAMALSYNGQRHMGFFRYDVGTAAICTVVASTAIVVAMSWRFLSASDLAQSRRIPWSRCCKRCDVAVDVEDCSNPFPETRLEVAKMMAKRALAVLCMPRFFGFLCYQLVAPSIMYMASPTDGMMRRYWVEVQQMQQQFTMLFTALFYFVLLLGIRTWFLDSNWRTVVFTAIVTSVVASVPVDIITAFDVVRDQYLFLSQDLFTSVPSAANFVVATLACLAIAPIGHEGTVYGFVTTVLALAPPTGRALSNWMYGMLPAWYSGDQSDIGILSRKSMYVADTGEFRRLVAFVVGINAAITLSAIVFLPLLPPNKFHAAQLGVYQPQTASRILGWLTLMIILVVFVVSTTLNFLAILPATSCHRFVGGPGCSSD